jgi:predicted nucleic-acid-binding protein
VYKRQLRYIAKDDAEQASIAADVLEQNHCLVQHTVLLETVWVLSSKKSFALPKEVVLSGIREVLGLPTVFVRNEPAVAAALAWYEAGMDFADALHFSLAHKLIGFATFDRRMRNKADQLNIPQNLIFLGKEPH